ncbi:MarR family transcriptional regulator [Pseudonocardiaceae bacterium YIM PH 21723]|nr:MarR family transcriptional regulator [Pseudonocardiaceae bacterium YIM PH 21723]
MVFESRYLDADLLRCWRAFIAMSEMLEGRLNQNLRSVGMSHADYTMLILLSEADGHRLGLSELGNEAQWSKSRISHQIRRMQDRGLVRRLEDPEDPRRAIAVLTPEGLTALEKAAPVHLSAVRKDFLDHLSPLQREQLEDIARTVLPHLGPLPPGFED